MANIRQTGVPRPHKPRALRPGLFRAPYHPRNDHILTSPPGTRAVVFQVANVELLAHPDLSGKRQSMFTLGIASVWAAFGSQVAMTSLPPTLVSIEVYDDPPYTVGHRIDITQAQAGIPRTAAEVHERTWLATRVLDGRSEIVSSADCPAISSVASSFADLPEIPISPFGLQYGESQSIGPTMRGGIGTKLNFSSRMPDNVSVEVEVTGGIFQRWGHQAVTDLMDCWEPPTTL